MVENGKKADVNIRYELIGIIDVPAYPESEPLTGYYLKDKTTGTIRGFSSGEAWQLISEEGSINASAEMDAEGKQMIKTKTGMLPINHDEWKISAWQESGDLYATLTEAAWESLESSLETASQALAEEITSRLFFEAAFNETDFYAVKEAISQAETIAVLTGAGVSTMSGIPDYRSVAMGMWEKDPQLLEHLNEYTFQQDPSLFWENFYLLIKNTLRPLLPFPNHTSLLAAIKAIRPNQTHLFFSWLEAERGKKVNIITQNVDGLHQQAGSEKVIEFHGNVLNATCRSCGRSYSLAEVIRENEKPECLVCSGDLRPDAVFFGDPVKGIEESIQAVEAADLIIVAGSSMQVYPFNSLINHVSRDKKLVYINGEPPEEPAVYDDVLAGNLSEISEKLKKLL